MDISKAVIGQTFLFLRRISHLLFSFIGYGAPLCNDEYEAGREMIGTQKPGHLGNGTERDIPKKGKNLLANVYDTWPRGEINYKIDAIFNANERLSLIHI